jgi:mono/diheme cytochrome c family protein
VLSRYTDAQLETAIRHGVRADGRGIFIMPSDEYQHLGDEDVSAIIAYLRTLSPVNREHGRSYLGPLGRALYTAGQLPVVPAERIDHGRTGARTAPPSGPTREYGQYLVSVGGCRACHGPNLVGGPSPEPGAPDAANITPAGPIGTWSEAARREMDEQRPRRAPARGGRFHREWGCRGTEEKRGEQGTDARPPVPLSSPVPLYPSDAVFGMRYAVGAGAR